MRYFFHKLTLGKGLILLSCLGLILGLGQDTSEAMGNGYSVNEPVKSIGQNAPHNQSAFLLPETNPPLQRIDERFGTAGIQAAQLMV